MKNATGRRFFAGLLAVMMLLSGCRSRGSEKSDGTSPTYQVPEFQDSVFQEQSAEKSGGMQADLSQLEQGIVGVKATGNTRLKFQIVCGEEKYNYDLPTDGTAVFFPLNMGNGTYIFRLMEQVEGSKYTCSWSESREVTLKNEFAPFLRPNQMVSYGENSKCTQKARGLAAGCGTDSEAAAAIYDFLVEDIRYDQQKADTVQSGYLPAPDETLETGTGICFDYASLAAAMLRSLGIPCKLITGYVGESTYHAWNSFYLENEGWITAEIRVSANHWQRVDITFAAGGMPAGQITGSTEYTTRYTY